MRKHKWRVKLLSEFWYLYQFYLFFPTNPALLGLNVGVGIHVKLRLRRPNRVLDTMLHELCQNAHGPHNASFYKLCDELRKECEELMSKGITGIGEGFDLLGRHLGGFSRQPPLSSLRQTALAAAENRACLGSLLPSRPKRLGGDRTIRDALSPIQVAAMAAERRLLDDIWCRSFGLGSGRTEIEHAFGGISLKRSHGQDKPESSFVDLTTPPLSGSSINEGSKSPKRSCKSNNLIPHQSSSSATFFALMLNYDSLENQRVTAVWECQSCTLLNPPLAPICKLCCMERPRDISTKYKFWSCKFCTLENSVKLDKCSACDQWRYSHGAPISTPANVGT
ncbi:hypothetical protein CXB51_003116 [Gossypium anomalum]|uniref:RanBP2-type domain-containing protein n=1 Tax=Gossypium anomalum TaxID=47600 RepID=A0A8J5Z5N3_9ROSI|nr:hypothetical protein CXB51_003116 [Gossypium anomalum]